MPDIYLKIAKMPELDDFLEALDDLSEQFDREEFQKAFADVMSDIITKEAELSEIAEGLV